GALTDARGTVRAGFGAVPGKRGQVHEHDVAGLHDAVGEIAPVRPGVGAGRDDHVLHVLHAGDVVEIFHQVRRDLVFGDAGPQELHAFPVRGVADRADHAHTFLLVGILDGARFHHRRHAVDPVDLLVLENVEHVDVDEVDAELLSGDAMALHLVKDRVGELLDLLFRGRAGCAFAPGIGGADVLLRDPRRVAHDLEP